MYLQQVEIYDGYDNSSNLIAQIVNAYYVPYPIVSYTGIMSIYFTTDGDLQYTGFVAHYESCNLYLLIIFFILIYF